MYSWEEPSVFRWEEQSVYSWEEQSALQWVESSVLPSSALLNWNQVYPPHCSCQTILPVVSQTAFRRRDPLQYR